MHLLNLKAMSPKGNKGILCSSTEELIEAFESANKYDDSKRPLKKDYRFYGRCFLFHQAGFR